MVATTRRRLRFGKSKGKSMSSDEAEKRLKSATRKPTKKKISKQLVKVGKQLQDLGRINQRGLRQAWSDDDEVAHTEATLGEGEQKQLYLAIQSMLADCTISQLRNLQRNLQRSDPDVFDEHCECPPNDKRKKAKKDDIKNDAINLVIRIWVSMALNDLKNKASAWTKEYDNDRSFQKKILSSKSDKLTVIRMLIECSVDAVTPFEFEDADPTQGPGPSTSLPRRRGRPKKQTNSSKQESKKDKGRGASKPKPLISYTLYAPKRSKRKRAADVTDFEEEGAGGGEEEGTAGNEWTPSITDAFNSCARTKKGRQALIITMACLAVDISRYDEWVVAQEYIAAQEDLPTKDQFARGEKGGKGSKTRKGGKGREGGRGGKAMDWESTATTLFEGLLFGMNKDDLTCCLEARGAETWEELLITLLENRTPVNLDRAGQRLVRRWEKEWQKERLETNPNANANANEGMRTTRSGSRASKEKDKGKGKEKEKGKGKEGKGEGKRQTRASKRARTNVNGGGGRGGVR